MNRKRSDWNEISRLDPLWAILSDPEKRHGRWDLEDFFATGRREINQVLATGDQWGAPKEHRQALDFGSGVGRLARAMAGHFDHVVGFDISDEMVSRARDLNADVPTCDFVVLDDSGLANLETRSFDFIYSSLVLQHITDSRTIERLLPDFVRLLAEGGLLVFQLPSYIPIRRRLQVRPRAYAALRGLRVSEHTLYQRLGLHPIRMNAVQEDSVVRLVTGVGATILKVDRSVVKGTEIEDRTYYVSVGSAHR